MTNHWADIANATNIVVWGANPVENHPACIAHINRARFPKQYFTDARKNKKAAKLIVIDPRRTRTALQVDESIGDKYIRIRPGTDIAFQNGLVRYMIEKIEAMPSGAGTVHDAFFAHLNWNGAGTFFVDGSATTASGAAAVAVPATGNSGGNSKYTDARFLVNAAGTDYQRDRVLQADGNITATGPDNTTLSNFPLKATTVTASEDTVYSRLKAHVAPYTTAVVADICGCQETDISFVGDAFIENSKCSTGTLFDARHPDFRVTTILYAMGITQHTCGSQNIKGFALIQTLMGNMGRQGGGINALRGIHNVQGSTDMGLLFGNIPAYSANPGTQVDGGPNWTTTPSTNNAFGKYMDNLWGYPLSGSGATRIMDGSYANSYETAMMGLQQRGFYNMTLKWFGDYTTINALTGTAKRAAIDACFSLWPKGNGSDHVTMFRQMASGLTKAAVVWGQNPAVTEPNQGAVRSGLYELDVLVCTDLFLNETGAVSRKPAGVTYLIPTAAHVEKAGSATNSGRTLQWRYQATAPAGNTKDDTELLLRFAKALDTAGAFSHIKTVWDTNSIAYTTDVYTQLFQLPYGGYTGTGTGFAALTGTGELANMRKNVDEAITYNTSANNLVGSEWVAECAYREMCGGVAAAALAGTIWIYTNGYTADYTSNKHAAAAAPALLWDGVVPGNGTTGGTAQPNWGAYNRAKCRDRADGNFQLAYPGWGYSWLVNRRVFYNNSDVPGDVGDFYMGADSCARLFTSSAPPALLQYSRWYRTYHKLADKPSPVVAADTTSPHYVMDTQVVPAKISYGGKFPAHTEPYETPRQDLLAVGGWGRNTKNTGVWDLVKNDTPVAGRGLAGDPAASEFPLTLTSIRCVEHFQGGPITRNNWHNVELEPEPWIEINSSDARKYGISDGNRVKVVTARTEALAGNQIAPYGEGFLARVGTGLSGSQKVGPGVVAIPWHWGEQGLSTGSRANDITIDAADANSVIPEYKACLCRIEKI